VLEFGERNCSLASAQLVSCEAESQAEDFCFLEGGQHLLLAIVRIVMEGEQLTSLACSLVNALGLVAAGGISAAKRSGSVAVVAQEASPAEVSKRELVSRLGDRDRVAYIWTY
jgi:hypothetical protein